MRSRAIEHTNPRLQASAANDANSTENFNLYQTPLVVNSSFYKCKS